jgi:hypothetical protein
MLPSEFLNIIRQVLSSPDGDALYLNSLVLELAVWIIILLVSLLFLRHRPKRLDRLEGSFARFAHRKGVAIASIAVLALAVRLALMPWIPIPSPIVHDEYSYILGAKTLAAGRLTNPAHPLWVHFESFHINVFPTYQSMYPPGQAAMLAVGVLLFGHPWWVVWLSVAVMCAAITWMLQGWMRPQWALLGGLFCVMRFATFSYWTNSYWGGALAATGGALLLGALPRLLHKRTAAYALLFALGLLMLAETRPYEGFVFSVPAVTYLLVWFFRKRLWSVDTLKRVLAPAVALLIVGAAFQLYYNWRGTGSALLMPYMVNERTYHISKPFLWEGGSSIPQYHHRVMRTFYILQELPDSIKSRQEWGIEEMERHKIAVYYEFFVWPLLLLSIFAVWQMMKSRRMRLFPLTLLLFLGGLLVVGWKPQPHYAAPVLCVVVATVLYGLRLLRTWCPRGLPVGLMVSRAVVVVILAWSVAPLAQRMMNPWMLGGSWMPDQVDRARIQAELEGTPGQHLVIVHNHLSATGTYDWVYNEPDIDDAKVVWARDMGAKKNEELLRYFSHRRVWLVDQDDGVRRLNVYLEGTSEQIPAAISPPSQKGQKH